MSGSVAPYLALITAEHANKPNFVSTVALSCQGSADNQVVLNSLQTIFDLDTAAGQQLDFLGQWVGVTRNLTESLTGVYFSLDSATLGLDQGYLQGPFDPTTGLVSLDDGTYRTLLRAKIASNNWNGSIPDAYTVWDTLFAGTGTSILIQDNGNMTMLMLLTGPIPTPVIQALFEGGYLVLKPAGVGATYIVPSVSGAPYFGLDVENSAIAGLDVGAFGTMGTS